MPGEKFKVFTEIPTNEKMIVNMVTNDQLTLEDACDLLNKQDYKIQQIKTILQDMTEENKELKQFKEQVFALIDKKLEENERELNGVDTARYYANKGTLNELKKELFE